MSLCGIEPMCFETCSRKLLVAHRLNLKSGGAYGIRRWVTAYCSPSSNCGPRRGSAAPTSSEVCVFEVLCLCSMKPPGQGDCSLKERRGRLQRRPPWVSFPLSNVGVCDKAGWSASSRHHISHNCVTEPNLFPGQVESCSALSEVCCLLWAWCM